MIDKLQYLTGYLRIKVWGFSPERFLNLCSNRDILLWDIEREGDCFHLNISLKNFYKLRPIARKTGVRVAILKRCGLPFLAPQAKKRKGFVAGLVLSAAFWILSANFVWDIRFQGNLEITDDVLKDFIKAENVYVGMAKKSLDIDRLEKDLRKTFPQITWTSAKLSGVKLIVDIKENDAPIREESEEEKQAEASSLIAEDDGVIVSIIVRKGIPKVAEGDEVSKGDVLVEGMVPIYNDDKTIRDYTYVDADADIVMEHTRIFAETLSDTHVEKEYTGRTKNRYFLRFFEKELRQPGKEPFLVCDSVIKLTRPQLFEKLSIPVFFGKNTYREYQNVEYKYSIPEVKNEFNKKLSNFLAGLDEKGVQIVEKNVKIDHNREGWVLEGEFRVQENVGSRVVLDRDGSVFEAQ